MLSGRGNFSSETLINILELCGLPSAGVFGAAFGADEAPAKMEVIQRKIDALKTLKARSEHFPTEAGRSLLGQRDLMPHPLDGFRLRVDAGEEFDTALKDELAKAYEELSELAAELKAEADRGREAMKAC